MTVPSFFPDECELDSETLYDLFEGFGVGDYETKLSGRHYKKVRTIYEDSVDNLVAAFGFSNWHEKWYLKKSLIPFCSGWKRKVLTEGK